jgi:hypothetical protein
MFSTHFAEHNLYLFCWTHSLLICWTNFLLLNSFSPLFAGYILYYFWWFSNNFLDTLYSYFLEYTIIIHTSFWTHCLLIFQCPISPYARYSLFKISSFSTPLCLLRTSPPFHLFSLPSPPWVVGSISQIPDPLKFGLIGVIFRLQLSIFPIPAADKRCDHLHYTRTVSQALFTKEYLTSNTVNNFPFCSKLLSYFCLDLDRSFFQLSFM